MACLGIHCGVVGGERDCLLRKPAATGFIDDRSCRNHRLSIPNATVKSTFPRICTKAVNAMSAAPVSNSDSYLFGSGLDLVPVDKGFSDEDSTVGSPRVSEKFDDWIKSSVTEIVKNIKQAPLLLQIYPDGEVKTEKAMSPEDWPEVMWRNRQTSPDGIILVEELRDNRDAAESGEAADNDEDGTKAFGVLIQGKGRDHCKSSCYLLKTSRVNGGGGMGGIFCTHFCLMKVQSFRKSAFSQFNDCWLLQ